MGGLAPPPSPHAAAAAAREAGSITTGSSSSTRVKILRPAHNPMGIQKITSSIRGISRKLLLLLSREHIIKDQQEQNQQQQQEQEQETVTTAAGQLHSAPAPAAAIEEEGCMQNHEQCHGSHSSFAELQYDVYNEDDYNIIWKHYAYMHPVWTGDFGKYNLSASSNLTGRAKVCWGVTPA